MAIPWLTIVVPTIGRAEIVRTFDSIDAQVNNGSVQVLVVGDTHGGSTPELERARLETLARGPRYRWLTHDAGLHMVGQPQRQYGMEHAAGAWVAFSADDNIFSRNAIANIWQEVATAPHMQPLIFKVRTWQAGVVWQRQEIAHGNVDADCAVMPNDPAKLGQWANLYEGDWCFIRDTAALYDGNVKWCDSVISLARPNKDELWWLSRKG